MKKSYFFIGLILIFGFMFIGKSQKETMVQSSTYNKMLQVLLTHDVPEVGVADILASEEIIILDARKKDEYEVSHIKNALWVGYDDFKQDRLLEVSKNQNIIVYCSVGYRSEKITQKLINLGYTNTSNLYGGLFEWVNQDRPVVDQNGTTNKIHGFSRLWSVWLKKGEKVY